MRFNPHRASRRACSYKNYSFSPPPKTRADANFGPQGIRYLEKFSPRDAITLNMPKDFSHENAIVTHKTMAVTRLRHRESIQMHHLSRGPQKSKHSRKTQTATT